MTIVSAGPELTSATIDDLRGALRGQLLTPQSAAYEDLRSVWNAMIDRCPAIIVRCLGAADVIACVRVARDHGIPLSIKGGGHNIAGLAVCDGLMLDMSLMRGVWVDPRARVAHAQPGCLLGDVDRETQLHGLAAVLGFVSNTGIAGLTLGGGIGYLTRRFGWTSDNVRSIDVVTANGSLVRASERENADLFWALRGGGGNFGVATNIEYQLHAVGPEIVAGAIAWPANMAAEVLELFRATALSAPRELTCAALLRNAPAAPWLPKDIHGTPIVAVVFCHTGSIADGERQAAVFKELGNPVGDVITRRWYVQQQSLLDATQPKGRRYYWKSEYLPALEPAVLKRAAEHAARIRSPHSAIILFPVGGALNDLPEGHSAVGNRDARILLNIAASWERSADDAANIAWARETWSDLREFSTGGVYINFLTEDEGDDRIQAAYRSNLDRLRAIKSTWDPTNLFRANKNVTPLGSLLP